LNSKINGEKIMKKQIYSIAVAVAFVVPSLASAHVDVEKVRENKIIVSYSADEAATPSGRAELVNEVRRAAEKLCGPQNLGRAGSLSELRENKSCFESAVAQALETISQTV
jgi:UrcA family protein